MSTDVDDLYETRRRNARLLARRMGGQKALAVIMDRDPSQVSSVIGKRPRDNIGNKLARIIEEAGGVEEGWLDGDGVGSATLAGAAFSDIDFLEMVLQEIDDLAEVNATELSPRKMATIIYNTYLVKDRFAGAALEQLKPHIQELLSLAFAD